MPTLEQLIGQENLKTLLRDTYVGSQKSGMRVPHGLFLGPRGMGKTTFARALAQTIGIPLVSETAAQKGAKVDDMVRNWLVHPFNFLPGIVFLDEIHNLSKDNQNQMLTLLSEGRYTEKNGNNLTAKYLVMIGATTDPGLLIEPFIDRFSKFDFEPYEEWELVQHALTFAHSLKMEVTEEWAYELVHSPNIQTPRDIVHRIEQSVRREAMGKSIDPMAVANSLGLDAMGLRHIDRVLLVNLLASGTTASAQRLAMRSKYPLREVRNSLGTLADMALVESAPGRGSTLTDEGINAAHKINFERETNDN